MQYIIIVILKYLLKLFQSINRSRKLMKTPLEKIINGTDKFNRNSIQENIPSSWNKYCKYQLKLQVHNSSARLYVCFLLLQQLLDERTKSQANGNPLNLNGKFIKAGTLMKCGHSAVVSEVVIHFTASSPLKIQVLLEGERFMNILYSKKNSLEEGVVRSAFASFLNFYRKRVFLIDVYQ